MLKGVIEALKNFYTLGNLKCSFGSNRPGDIPHSNADISKAKNMVGYDPKISSDEGMKKYINI